MLIQNTRNVPDPNDLNRYAVNLGALGFGRRSAARREARKATAIAQSKATLPAAGSDTDVVQLTEAAAAVKEYFDVGVYRNILDMINTFEGVLNRFAQAIANELCCVGNQSRIAGARNANQNPFAEPAGYGNGDTSRIVIRTGSLQLATAIGYAAGKVGAQNKNEAQVYAQQMIKKAGLGCGAAVGFFQVPDLLNMARMVEYEMNRVRLPTPHNFRQIANAIQGRDYRLCSKWHTQMNLPPKPSSQQWKYGGVRGSYFSKLDQIFSANYINAVELLQVVTDLKRSMTAMRNGIRKEIDAANLARKVQEETIRREQEALITRQQAEEQARQRELEIMAEKKAAYEKELAEAEKLRAEMQATREALAAEMESLKIAEEAAQTPEEAAVIEQQQIEVAQAAVEVDRVEADKTAAAETAVVAAENLGVQIEQKKEELIQAGVVGPGVRFEPPTAKAKIPVPVILTAAGLLLL